ncbi:MAG TPA: cell division protein FtsA, partial [Fibrobacteraceae bacterium]|nr:cell division protein FtsA [Fibrobacteraceae bacterium]
QTGIKDPVGMNGVRLEGDVHIVTANTSSIQNIYKSLERSGIKIADIVLEPLASSFAVLEKDERELGVAVLDIGGGTTDLAIFIDDSIRYTNCLDLGGENVTNDVAMGISTPKERAEEIKRKWGTCTLSSLIRDEYVTVPGVAGREDKQVSREFLAKIVRARMTEIFQLVSKDIQRTKLRDKIGAGIVLTGGSSMINGIEELALEIFNMPVKFGQPKGGSGLADAIGSPIHATGLGLVLYGVQQMQQEAKASNSRLLGSPQGFKDVMRRFFAALKNYV